MFMQLLGRFSRLPSWLPAIANDVDLCRRVGEGIPRLPLVPLSTVDVWRLGIFLSVCWKTTRIFPYHYAELMEIRCPANGLLPGRNLLFAVLQALTRSLPTGEKKEPSTARMEAL